VVTRENVEQGLPNVLMWCDNKKCCATGRVLPNVNLYNLHYNRHVSTAAFHPRKKNRHGCFDVPTDVPDRAGRRSRLFSVGRYRVEALVEAGAARLKSVMVIADTGSCPRYLQPPFSLFFLFCSVMQMHNETTFAAWESGIRGLSPIRELRRFSGYPALLTTLRRQRWAEDSSTVYVGGRPL